MPPDRRHIDKYMKNVYKESLQCANGKVIVFNINKL